MKQNSHIKLNSLRVRPHVDSYFCNSDGRHVPVAYNAHNDSSRSFYLLATHLYRYRFYSCLPNDSSSALFLKHELYSPSSAVANVYNPAKQEAIFALCLVILRRDHGDSGVTFASGSQAQYLMSKIHEPPKNNQPPGGQPEVGASS